MKVLVTNDDGIRGRGLEALVGALKPLHEVTVVAPDGERSGVSHGVTYMNRFWVESYPMAGVRAFHTSGTPADCLRWALADGRAELDRPDLVISGINRGHNCGFHVFYSGTVAAARQAAMSGVKAAAISMDYSDMENADAVARLAVELLFDRLMSCFDSPRVVLNVNFPRYERVRDLNFVWTRQSEVLEPEVFHPDECEGDRTHYTPQFGEYTEPESGSDRWAVREGRISVTRLACTLSLDARQNNNGTGTADERR